MKMTKTQELVMQLNLDCATLSDELQELKTRRVVIELYNGSVTDVHNAGDNWIVADWDVRKEFGACVICETPAVIDECHICGFKNINHRSTEEFIIAHEKMMDYQNKTIEQLKEIASE